jgi:uncharacterized protein
MTTVASTSASASPRDRPAAGRRFIQSHPLLSYFSLTFAVSWAGVLVAVAADGFPASPDTYDALLPGAILAMLAGPPVAGILLTTLIDGRAGLREMLTRLLRWRLDARWYGVALLTAPLATAAVLLALSPLSPEVRPGILATSDRTSRLLLGIGAALGAGFFEEIGWTGFALPRLGARHGVLGAGLRLGFVWGAWHLLVNVWASRTYMGEVPALLFLTAGLFSTLLVYRVAMVWVYDRTGSLFVAMLMHASLTACTIILNPLTTGAALLTYDVVLAAALWIVVAAVAMANGGHLSRQPLPKRAG